MFKSKAEIFTLYSDHAESVEMSGCGHDKSAEEIGSHMLQALKEFDEGATFVPWTVLSHGL